MPWKAYPDIEHLLHSRTDAMMELKWLPDFLMHGCWTAKPQYHPIGEGFLLFFKVAGRMGEGEGHFLKSVTKYTRNIAKQKQNKTKSFQARGGGSTGDSVTKFVRNMSNKKQHTHTHSPKTYNFLVFQPVSAFICLNTHLYWFVYMRNNFYVFLRICTHFTYL